MEKLLFLAPDGTTVSRALDMLHGMGISDERIGVVANEKTKLESLPEADLTDTSDVVPALARGVGVGAACGTLAGLAMIAFPPAGLVVGGSALVVGALGGATFGAFTSSLIGTSVKNSQLREFEDALESGQLLLIVEADPSDHDSINKALESQVSRLTIEGVKEAVPKIV